MWRLSHKVGLCFLVGPLPPEAIRHRCGRPRGLPAPEPSSRLRPSLTPAPRALCGLVGSLFLLLPRPFPWSSAHSSWRKVITHCQSLGERRAWTCRCVRRLGSSHPAHLASSWDPSTAQRGLLPVLQGRAGTLLELFTQAVLAPPVPLCPRA